MTTGRDHACWRLGLLLAGGGRLLRSVAAGASPDDDTALARGAPSAELLEKAERLARHDAPALLERMAALRWRWITPADRDFPPDLSTTADPPLGLFVRGSLSPRPRIAIVGSRRATPYGLQVARLLAVEMARAGVIVVSGMARGVDREAHEGALEAGGETWAIWGAGPDRVYPAEHRRLSERIAASGALITEYPPGTPPRKHHFPERNRLIAGATPAVVVVEATARSGALVTAKLALEEGREVLAVPGSILSDLSVGPNALLRLGARPAVTPRDLLEVLGVGAGSTGPDPRPPADDPLVLALAPGEAVGVDELARRLGWPVGRVTARAVELELEGRLVRRSDGEYRRREVQPGRDAE